jgi:hypothetical protein
VSLQEHVATQVRRPTYYLQSGSSFENPYGVPPDELVDLILESTPEIVAQVVFGRYVPSSGLVYSSRLILNLFDQLRVPQAEWLDEACRGQWIAECEHYGLRPRFFGGVDLARKKDQTVLFVLDSDPVRQERPARVVYYRRLNRVPWEVVYAAVGRACWLFGAELLLDSTGAGDVVCEELDGRRYCAVHDRTVSGFGACEDHKGDRLNCDPGDYHRMVLGRFEIQTSSKVQLLTHLAQVLGHDFRPHDPSHPFGLVRSPLIPELQLELAGYQWDDKKLRTDHVIAFALACWMAVRELPGAAAVGSVYGSERSG